tara:strand:+ start:323 stop:589 length:267 start_codon:yes stop_codon:yes gene_type:complete
MENKTIIILAIISAIGSFFEPTLTLEKKKTNKDVTTCKSELYIDSMRNVNDSLLHKLKIENKELLEDNKKLKRKRKYYKTKNGKKVYR